MKTVERSRFANSMLNETQRADLAAPLLQMRIIVFALAMGVAMTTVIFLAIADGEPADDPLISYIALGFAVMMVVVWLVVPNLLTRHVRHELAGQQAAGTAFEREATVSDSAIAPLLKAYLARLIVGCALLEGAALFNLVAYLVEGSLSNVVVAGILLLLILSHFPTRDRVADWVARQWEASRHESARQF